MKMQYFMIESIVAERKDLSSTEKLVYGLISSLEKNRMSQREMADQLGVNVSQINRAIKKLVTLGLVEKAPTLKRMRESFKKGGMQDDAVPLNMVNYLTARGIMPFKQLKDYYNTNYKNSKEIIVDEEIKEILDQVYKPRKQRKG